MPIKVFSVSCLPPASYFSEFLSSSDHILDPAEHFIRQTHRNRFTILSANGPITLTIPVQHPASSKAMRDVRISYQDEWIRKHDNAIRSAYGRASYFEFLNDDLMNIFKNKHAFLFDLNLELLNWVFKILKEDPELNFSESYIEPSENIKDLRIDLIGSDSKEYYQVFSDKFGFVPDLSILDMIFNLGPDTRSLINRSN